MAPSICDYSYSRPDPDAMAADGIVTVVRYLRDGSKAGKALTPGEVLRLEEAGIGLCSNEETTGVQYLGGFSGGRTDAQRADEVHQRCGGPPNRPIFFTPLDHDPAGLDVVGWNLLRRYADGVIAVLGVERVGWYGGTKLLRTLRAEDRGRWWWQALGWRQGVWLDWVHLQQYQNGVARWGGEVDYDRALKADYGQWDYRAPEQPQVEEDPSMAGYADWDDESREAFWKEMAYRFGALVRGGNSRVPGASIGMDADHLPGGLGALRVEVDAHGATLDEHTEVLEQLKTMLAEHAAPPPMAPEVG